MTHPPEPDQLRADRPVTTEDRSLGELFAELSRETRTLVHQEVDLAKIEMRQKAAQIGKDVGFLAVGGAILYAGLLALIAALVIGLGQAGLPWWLSALIVGLIVAGVGGFLVWKGLNHLKHESAVPQNTLESLKEDAHWAKEQTS